MNSEKLSFQRRDQQLPDDETVAGDQPVDPLTSPMAIGQTIRTSSSMRRARVSNAESCMVRDFLPWRDVIAAGRWGCRHGDPGRIHIFITVIC